MPMSKNEYNVALKIPIELQPLNQMIENHKKISLTSYIISYFTFLSRCFVLPHHHF